MRLIKWFKRKYHSFWWKRCRFGKKTGACNAYYDYILAKALRERIHEAILYGDRDEPDRLTWMYKEYRAAISLQPYRMENWLEMYKK